MDSTLGLHIRTCMYVVCYSTHGKCVRADAHIHKCTAVKTAHMDAQDMCLSLRASTNAVYLCIVVCMYSAKAPFQSFDVNFGSYTCDIKVFTKHKIQHWSCRNFRVLLTNDATRSCRSVCPRSENKSHVSNLVSFVGATACVHSFIYAHTHVPFFVKK